MPSGQKPKIYPAEVVDAVSRHYADGRTQSEIGSILGLSQKVVWNIMRRHNLTARVAAKRDQWGKNNPQWKGDDASKYAFHRRLYARFGKPTKCSVCGTEASKHYDYANLSGRYEDIEDYAAMCRSCHWKYDDKVNNITKGGMPNAQA